MTALLPGITIAQGLYTQRLTDNKGYIPIKENDIKLIDHYTKILHLINLTNYHHSIDIIGTNINLLNGTISDVKPLLNTLEHNFTLLKAKVNNLSPHFRNKRGLINVLGKGVKFITGNMDNDDEIEIRNALNIFTTNQKEESFKLNSLIQVSEILSSQIENITTHINTQQTMITKHINRFRNEIQNKIQDLEDEMLFLKHVYQIDNDITLLRNHVDDIGQIIFTGKLGIIPTDVLDDKEIKLIDDYETYTNIKIGITYFNENILIALSIPKYSPKLFSQILFEPIPNKENKSLYLTENRILIDGKDNLYHANLTSKNIKNLEPFKDHCIENIIRNKTPECNFKKFEGYEIKEIKQGFLLFKNYYGNVSHDCIRETDEELFGTFILNFQNCKVFAENKTYYNNEIKFKENIILSNLITEINENKTYLDVKLEDLYLKQINYESNFKRIEFDNKRNKIFNVTSNGINITIIIAIIIIVTLLYKKKINIYHISPEPQSNGGGVTITPNRIII